MLCIQFSPNPTHVIKLPQLLSADVLNFYLTGSDCSDLVSKLRRHTVATTFFLRSHCQTCAGCPEMILLCFNRTAALRIELCRYKRAFKLIARELPPPTTTTMTPCRRNKRYVHSRPRMTARVKNCMTQVTEATSKTNYRALRCQRRRR